MSRPIADVLREINAGEFYDEASDALGELVAAVVEARAGGSLTLKISVKPNGENSVKVAAEHVSKLPKMPRGESLFFVQGTGDLVRNDPRQEEMFGGRPVRSVADDEGKTRKIGGYDE